jgi:hypothetical protein
MIKGIITKTINVWETSSSNPKRYISFTIREDTIDGGEKSICLGSKEELEVFLWNVYSFYPSSSDLDALPNNFPIPLQEWITDSIRRKIEGDCFNTLDLLRNGLIK